MIPKIAAQQMSTLLRTRRSLAIEAINAVIMRFYSLWKIVMQGPERDRTYGRIVFTCTHAQDGSAFTDSAVVTQEA